MTFDLQYTDPKSNARAGLITTDHGQIETPIFMPVGTLGTVKGVHLHELKEDIKAQIILGNTYHLYLRPGLDIIERAGGLHKFNGFADKFLVTPVNGLEDFYIDVTYKVKNAPGQLSIFNGLLLKAQYHDFKSEEGSIDYGTEFDFYAKMPLRRGVYVEAKYANYDADQFATDTEKFTLGVGWKY